MLAAFEAFDPCAQLFESALKRVQRKRQHDFEHVPGRLEGQAQGDGADGHVAGRHVDVDGDVAARRPGRAAPRSRRRRRGGSGDGGCAGVLPARLT